jgi:hypothetical protein
MPKRHKKILYPEAEPGLVMKLVRPKPLGLLQLYQDMGVF